MPVPDPVRLFHITAIANLPAICGAGALLAKNQLAASGVVYQNIAHQGAQGARAHRQMPDPPGGLLHGYVPFYFAPRSPMLMAIDGGRVEGCPWRQADIVHIETTVERAAADGQFVFFDRNATYAYADAFTDLAKLDRVAWDLILEAPRLDGFCKYFNDKSDPERYVGRREKRMAEFMVHGRLPLDRITRLGVIDKQKAEQVTAILRRGGIDLPVVVMRDWYFLGQ
jgi:hypothetical protein